ncbi:hypothetical protein, partial [Anaerotignum lactatifermentans]
FSYIEAFLCCPHNLEQFRNLAAFLRMKRLCLVNDEKYSPSILMCFPFRNGSPFTNAASEKRLKAQ